MNLKTQCKLVSQDGFDFIGAKKSSIFSFNSKCIQFFWHFNLLEEVEDFGFKFSSLSQEEMEVLDKLRESYSQVGKISDFKTTLHELAIKTQELCPRNFTELILTLKFVGDEFFRHDIPESTGEIICHCFGVLKKDLIENLGQGETWKISQLKDKFRVSLGCGTCLNDVHHFLATELDSPSFKSQKFEQLREQKVTDSDDLIRPKGLSPIDFKIFILEALRESPLKAELDKLRIEEVTGYKVTLSLNEKSLEAAMKCKIKEYFIDVHKLKINL